MNIDFSNIGQTPTSPVPFSPRESSKASRVAKRALLDEDGFSSTCSSPSTSSPSPFSHRETPSPSKKSKPQPSIRWLDGPGSNRDTPVSKTIASPYSLKDSEESTLDGSTCTSVDALDLWNAPSLYEENKNLPFDEEANEEKPLSSLKRSTRSIVFTESADDTELTNLFTSLKVVDIPEDCPSF